MAIRTRHLQLIFLTLFVVIVAFHRCVPPRSISGKNVGFLYSKDGGNDLYAQFIPYHKDPNTTLIYWRIRQSDLGRDQNEPHAQTISVSIRYRLYTSYSEPYPMDSGKVIIKERPISQGGFVLDSIVLPIALGRNYILDIGIKDLNSRRSARHFIDIVKSESFNRQSFVILGRDGGLLFDNYVPAADSYYVKCADYFPEMYQKFYQRDFPIASPPFSTVAPKPFDFTPDAIVPLQKNRGKWLLYITKPGFYQLVLDPEKKTGGAIYYFGEYYPEARMVMDLALPLRYITTNEEFEDVISGEKLKKDIDTYWLGIGGNTERARELIKAFYSRVEESNRYFASYIEGWKTDRGMCYIVFGPPSIVNRSTASETWLYGEEGRYNSLSLTFTKVVNPFTSNDFRLNRTGALKSPWYRAVDFWRQGRVLTYK